MSVFEDYQRGKYKMCKNDIKVQDSDGWWVVNDFSITPFNTEKECDEWISHMKKINAGGSDEELG